MWRWIVLVIVLRRGINLTIKRLNCRFQKNTAGHRNWNSDSFVNRKRLKILGGDVQRHQSLHGRVTSQWSRPQSRKFWIGESYKRLVAMKREPCSRKMEVSWSSDETHENQLKIQSNPVNDHSEESMSSEERKWDYIPAERNFKNYFEAEVSKLIMRLVRHYDQDVRETDGAVHWKSMCPKLRLAFHKWGGCDFSDSDWLQHIHKGSNKTRFQYCKNPKDVQLYSSAQEMKTKGSERTPTNLKKNGISSLQKWWDISKKLDTQYSRVSVLWAFWKEKVADVLYT